MEDCFRHLHVPRDLATRFLAAFSRMEYALKSTEYSNGDDTGVSANWDKFANEIHDRFLSLTDPEVTNASDYLLNSPPKKQVLTHAKLDFVARSIDKSQKSTQQLLLMVRAVRNNLFHGGKYSPNAERDKGRNEKLVSHSLKVLEACSQLCGKVKDYYDM